MILEQRHSQSQKSCKKAEIFVFVMVGLPHQGKSCEKKRITLSESNKTLPRTMR